MFKRILVLVLLLTIIIGFFGYLFFFNKGTFLLNKGIEIKDDRPKDNEPYKESKIIKSEISDDKTEIKLKFDEYIVANGFIGASDNAYFTRNNVLYHLTISTDTITKIAEGIKHIEEDKDSLIVYKGDNFKIIKEDDYIIYVD